MQFIIAHFGKFCGLLSLIMGVLTIVITTRTKRQKQEHRPVAVSWPYLAAAFTCVALAFILIGIVNSR